MTLLREEYAGSEYAVFSVKYRIFRNWLSCNIVWFLKITQFWDFSKTCRRATVLTKLPITRPICQSEFGRFYLSARDPWLSG
jgi:hypothetical protein